MHPRVVVVIAVVLAVLGALFNVPQRTVEAAAKKPDIVLFYLDDNAPYPVRMWDDPARTPNLARFARNGLEFTNALDIHAVPVVGEQLRSGDLDGLAVEAIAGGVLSCGADGPGAPGELVSPGIVVVRRGRQTAAV